MSDSGVVLCLAEAGKGMLGLLRSEGSIEGQNHALAGGESQAYLGTAEFVPRCHAWATMAPCQSPSRIGTITASSSSSRHLLISSRVRSSSLLRPRLGTGHCF